VTEISRAVAISSGSSNRMPLRDERNRGLRKGRRDNPTVPRKLRRRIATNVVANGSGADAVGSGSLDNVSVWVNEGGAGGEVMR
jgi:hypothetical protein